MVRIVQTELTVKKRILYRKVPNHFCFSPTTNWFFRSFLPIHSPRRVYIFLKMKNHPIFRVKMTKLQLAHEKVELTLSHSSSHFILSHQIIFSLLRSIIEVAKQDETLSSIKRSFYPSLVARLRVYFVAALYYIPYQTKPRGRNSCCICLIQTCD